MPHTAEEVTRSALAGADHVLKDCLEIIEHCLGQLTDEQIWWRARPEMNSVGNLVLHLAGNLRQWVVAGLGGAVDVRHRQEEFDERGPVARDTLLAGIRQIVAESREILARVSADEMLARRVVQGFDLTGWQTLWDTVPHFKGHTQEIIAYTRMQLGTTYRIRWQPKTSEQGAPPK